MLRTLCDGHGGNGPSDADDNLKPEAWDLKKLTAAQVHLYYAW